MTEGFELPHEIELTPHDRGAICEAVFKTTHRPPEPVLVAIREFAYGEAPEWVDIQEVRFNLHKTKRVYYVTEIEGEERIWECDCSISAYYRRPMEERLELPDDQPRRWVYSSPSKSRRAREAV